MENIIVVVIWVGIFVFSAIAKARKKKAGKPVDDDWLDDQWQELIQTAEKKTQQQPKQQPAPPPLPAKKAVARTQQPTSQHAPLPSQGSAARTSQQQQDPPAKVHHRKKHKPATPKQPQRQAPPPPPQEAPSTRFVPTGSSLSMQGTSVAATSTGADRKERRRAEMKELIAGKKALKRAVLMREILDRPRSYDT